MRILACGGRDFQDAHIVRWAFEPYRKRRVVLIHGDARGADSLAAHVARGLGWEIVAVPADWERYGKRAGYVRNTTMLHLNPDLVIAFPGGKGTAMMIKIAYDAGVTVNVIG